MRPRFLALALTVLAALAGCGGGSEDESPAPAEPDGAGQAPQRSASEGAQAEDAKPGVTITTGSSQFGTALFDGDQRAIYYFDKEEGPESECYDDCAAAWPPVLTEGDPQADGDASQRLLGTTERDDGSTQVTYDDRPLYYYVDDPKGEILCHNVEEFGGLWLAIQPDGAPFA
jgi:predicted lipoprotein with Yx(FWY)xxD motif